MIRIARSLLAATLLCSGGLAAQERYADEYARTYGTQQRPTPVVQTYPVPIDRNDSYARGYDDPDARYSSSGYDHGYDNGYEYARVVRVDPIIGDRQGGYDSGMGRNCRYSESDEVYTRDGYYSGGGYRDRGYDDHGNGYRRDPYAGQRGNDASRTVATVVGGIAGAVLGSRIGDGSGRYVGTAVGSMVGGMAGRSIYDSAQRERQVTRGTVRVCDPVPVDAYGRDAGSGYYGSEQMQGYAVTYEYAGRTYQTRTSHHPGDRLRVRVDVRPD